MYTQQSLFLVFNSQDEVERVFSAVTLQTDFWIQTRWDVQEDSHIWLQVWIQGPFLVSFGSSSLQKYWRTGSDAVHIHTKTAHDGEQAARWKEHVSVLKSANAPF